MKSSHGITSSSRIHMVYKHIYTLLLAELISSETLFMSLYLLFEIFICSFCLSIFVLFTQKKTRMYSLLKLAGASKVYFSSQLPGELIKNCSSSPCVAHNVWHTCSGVAFGLMFVILICFWFTENKQKITNYVNVNCSHILTILLFGIFSSMRNQDI